MVTNADQAGPPSKEFMSLRLDASEKERVEKMKPSWQKNRPSGLKYVPDNFPIEVDNPPRFVKSDASSGANDPTTSNIPVGQWEERAEDGGRAAA